MPSTRPLARIASLGAVAVAALSCAGLAAAQANGDAGLELGVRLAVRFGVAFVVNLLLGAALVALAPDYAHRMVTAIRDDPGTAFLWGLLVGVAVPIALILLAITIIGLLITIPGLFLLAIVGLVGNAVTVVWIGSYPANVDDLGATAVGIGALALSLLTAVPILGNLAATLLGFFGLGVVGRDIYTSWQG
ncbi:MAG: hypothetical protein ABEI80_07980 [Haloplanus sp.]